MMPTFQDPYAAAAPRSLPELPVGFRVLLLHNKGMSNDTIEALTGQLLDQIQAAAGPEHRIGVISGRDSFIALAPPGKRKAQWPAWARTVATGWTSTPPIEPLFHLIVVPGDPQAPYVGKGAADVIQQALAARRAVRLWDPSTGQDWAVGSVLQEDWRNFQAGWRLLPGDRLL